MTEAELGARFIEALMRGADEAAGTTTTLVSVNMEIVAPLAHGALRVEVNRKTRTLAFMRADLIDGDGALIATASSVHKSAA
ncbi:MAG: hypothetical protein JNM59_08920 [Hyphomonadaceae bacterium]|nr:hypothetical protein [Hyphomonadaceae bacterium]